MMHILDNNKIRPTPYGFKSVYTTPHQKNITHSEFYIVNLLFRVVQAASFYGNDMKVEIALKVGFHQPLAQQGRLGRNDQFHNDGFLLTDAERQPFL
jgi:hypothetical protein